MTAILATRPRNKPIPAFWHTANGSTESLKKCGFQKIMTIDGKLIETISA